MKSMLNGHASRSFAINVGIAQGSMHGITLFRIFINNLPNDISSQLNVYADGTVIYS